MNILICDDNIHDSKHVEELCHVYEKTKNIKFQILTVNNCDDKAAFDADLIFLDIEMPQKSGIAIKEDLERIHSNSLIVFVTNYIDNVFDAFGLNVIGFLSKPLEYETLKTILDKAETLLIKHKIIQIEPALSVRVEDIRYISMDGVYSEIFLSTKTDRTHYIVRKSLSQWKQILPTDIFICINKSCVINCYHIDKYCKDFVLMNQGGEKLSISRRKKTECAEKYRTFSMMMARYGI